VFCCIWVGKEFEEGIFARKSVSATLHVPLAILVTDGVDNHGLCRNVSCCIFICLFLSTLSVKATREFPRTDSLGRYIYI
jgi:hypothetical protein